MRRPRMHRRNASFAALARGPTMRASTLALKGPTMSNFDPDAPRLLVVPGLHDSEPGHWQSWLQARHPGALRVQQRDWTQPNLDRWAARIGSTLAHAGPGPWLAVAHSFGVLALVRHLALVPDSPVAAVLLVAPADPDKFGLGESIPRDPLPVPSTVVLSSTDPWLALAQGQRWAQRWGSACVQLGAAGHVNLASGHRTLPLAEHWLRTQAARLADAEKRLSIIDSIRFPLAGRSLASAPPSRSLTPEHP